MLRRTVAAVIAAAVATSIVPLQGKQASAAPLSTEVDIVALGDSYTAGNGGGADSYYGPDGCYRSHGNYAEQFHRLIGSTGFYMNQACSGSVIDSVPGQISNLTAQERENTDLVFISAGGNDADFSTIVANCFVYPVLTQSVVPCVESVEHAWGILDDTVARTTNLLSSIASSFPNARIVFVGYPLLAGCTWRIFGEGNIPGITTTYDAGTEVRTLGGFADSKHRAMIAGLASQPWGLADKFMYFSRADLFAGHEPCGDLDDWINEAPDNTIKNAWFHPNLVGWTRTAEGLRDAGVADGLGGSVLAPDVGTLIGKVIQGPSNDSYVVTDSGTLSPIPDGGTYRCLTTWRSMPIHPGAFTGAQLALIPIDAQSASCSAPEAYGKVVRSSSSKSVFVDGTGFAHPIRTGHAFQCLIESGITVLDNKTDEHLEAFAVGADQPGCEKVLRVSSNSNAYYQGTDGVVHYIVDSDTWFCLADRGVRVHDGWTQEAINALPQGAQQPRCLSPARTANVVVRNPAGASFLTNGQGVRRSIATGGDYLCFTEYSKIPLRSLGADQVDSLPFDNTSNATCTIDRGSLVGKIMRRSSDGVTWYVGSDQQRHWIQDTQTYYALTDAGAQVIDGFSFDGANLIPEGTAQPKSLSPSRYRNTIIRRSDGVSWVVDELGRRRHIPDGYSFECYKERGYRVAETSLTYEQANSIPEVGRMGYCLAKWQANGTIIRECGGTAYYVENYNRRHIPSGWTYEAIQEWGRPVLNTCLNWEHIGSLPEVGRMPYLLPKWRFRNTLVHHASGAVFKTDGNACRYHVRDWWTVERLQELGHGFTGWNVNDEEINSLPYCGLHRFMLAKWRAENRVVRGPDGTSWFVRGGEWFWIPNGSIWNHLVRKYGLLGTFSWEHINSIKWDRGRWASYW